MLTTITKHIFEQFMDVKFPHISKDEHYYTEWKNRFEEGMEWQSADYHGRRVLQTIAPNIYPTDQDAFFVREG